MKNYRHAVYTISGANVPRSVVHVSLVALLFLLPCNAGVAATYYVGPSATGAGSGSDRSNLKSLAGFKAGAQPGDTALLQPGSYGELLITGGFGTASGGYVTYRADPATCTPRASTWFEETIDPPSASEAPIFERLGFGPHQSGGQPVGHYVRLEGLSVVDTGNPFYMLYFDPYVSHVTIKDCSLWGVEPADPLYHFASERSNGIFLYPIGSPGPIRDILIEDCYVQRVDSALFVSADTANVVVRGCHIHDSCQSLARCYSPVTLDGCHFHTQSCRPAVPAMAANLSIVSVGTPANRVFTHAGGHVAASVQWCRVTGGGKDELRQCNSGIPDAGSYVGSTITTDAPFSFAIVPGKHVVSLYNDTHGSMVAVFGSGVTVRNCRMRYAGTTGGIYNYQPGASNLTFENNLIYDAHNTSSGPFDFAAAGAGSHLTVINNTFVGRRHESYGPAVPQWRYGIAFRVGMHNADPSTWTISNNVFVGTASAPPAGAIARNNIVYANANASPGNPGSGYEEDAVGDNQGNLVYYKGQPYPQEPAPFDESRNFFVGGDDFSQAFVLHHGRNFNAAFRPADDSPARDFGAPECAPPVDMADVSRDNRPDAGAYEIVATGGNRRPVLAAVGNKSTSADTLLTFDLSATDADGDSLTYSAGTLPAGARLSGRTFTWKPTARQTGSYQVTFRVSDGQAQDSETITITVERSNARPILSTIGNKTIDENQVLTFSVSASDADRDPITYSAAGLPNGATFTGRTFTWTPGYDQAGTYNVTFAAGDGRAQDSQTIAISVANVNRPPVLARIGDRSAYESSPLAFALLAADPDGAGLTYSATGLPDGARLTGQNFSWTPNAGQIGSYEVTFLVNDGTLTDSETITITVAGAASDRTAPAVARQSPAPDTIQVPLNNLVTLYVTDAGRGVDPRSIQITVDGKLVYQGDTPLHTSAYGRCSRSGTANSYQFIYQPNQMFDFDHRVAVTVNASDLAGNVMNEHAYSFATEMRAFGNVKRASRMTMAGKEHPATVSDDQGNIWVAWHAGREGARDVYVALLPAARELFQTEMRITTDSRDQCNPELALGSDGSVYVVWQDDRRGHWDIYAAVCSDGRTFSQNLLVTDLEGNQTKPTAAVVPGSPDRVYVAWQDDRNGNQDICVGSSTNALATVTVAQVTTNAADQTEPDIAADGSNAVYLVWTDGRNGHADIYGAAPANAWANVPIVTDADDQTRPAIAIAPGGTTMHLVWMDNHAGDTDIYYASSTGLPASPLAGVNTVDDTSGANQTAPALACAGNGKVFACWEDMRNVGVYGRDVDVYFVELSSEAVKTNILVGDTGARANQGQPVVAVSAHDQPYMVWTDDRTRAKEIHCAGTTLIDPTPLHAVVVATATGATVGTDPAAITTPEDVSLVVPAGAAPDNVRITISKIHNPVVSPADCLGSYDFGPSGISFEQPVTVTIPYRLDQANRNARAYWYNPLTGAMSQQGISRIENIRISGNLYALRFKTTHFTPFYLLADGAEAASSGGGGGGCSISVTGDESPGHLLVPCGLVAVVMAILRHRDRKRAIHDIGQ